MVSVLITGVESASEQLGGGAAIHQLAVAVGLPVLLLLLLLLLLASSLWFKPKKNRASFPRAPPGWPILGHLPHLTTAPHRVLADLSRKHGYGPIFGLRLGSVPAVVVSSAALAKEVLHTQDKIFANRPPYQFVEELYYGYNTGVVFSSYNPRWAWMRKVFTLELFTANRLQQLQHIRQEELRRLLDRIREDSHGGTQTVDAGKLLADFTANSTARLLQSKTLQKQEGAPMDLPELMHYLVGEASFPSLGDFIPCLKFLSFFSSRRKQRIHGRIDQLMEFILHHRRQLMAHCPDPGDIPHDFLQDLFSGGTHTSAVTLEWAIAELLKNPRCMRKLQEEVDRVMESRDENKMVKDEDVGKMPYLVDTVKEVLRLHPVVPMLLPRMASQACKLDNYLLPKGTNVVVNVWAIARDPLYWNNPEEFRPERFRGMEVDVRGQHYELLPFGGGRRVCPGIRLGLALVHVTLANLVRIFHWALPPGQSPHSMDMSENKGGLSNSRALPMLVIPTPKTPYP